MFLNVPIKIIEIFKVIATLLHFYLHACGYYYLLEWTVLTFNADNQKKAHNVVNYQRNERLVVEVELKNTVNIRLKRGMI